MRRRPVLVRLLAAKTASGRRQTEQILHGRVPAVDPKIRVTQVLGRVAADIRPGLRDRMPALRSFRGRFYVAGPVMQATRRNS